MSGRFTQRHTWFEDHALCSVLGTTKTSSPATTSFSMIIDVVG